jgi:hypothetical protein
MPIVRVRIQSTVTAWRIPTILAMVTAIGLVTALLGDDSWDVASWLLLALPLAAAAYIWRNFAKRKMH